VANPLLDAADHVAAASKLPTSEIGSVLPGRHFVSGLGAGSLPGWSVIEAQSLERIPVPALRWPQSVWTYEDMRRDSQIQGLLQSVFLPIRHMEWYVDPTGTTGTVADEIAEDFGLPLLGDATDPDDGHGIDFNEHLRLALLAIARGHGFFEESGEIIGTGSAARYRLRRLSERPPTSIVRINVDPNGDLLSVWQHGVPIAEIPADRMLSYVWDREGGNWAGRPLLYGIYRNWLLKDQLVRGDVMTKRRFGGVPVVETTDSSVGKAETDAAAAMAQRLQAGDGAGTTTPFGTRLRLLGVEGTVPDSIASINYHDQQMARAFMQMFAELGNTAHGSRALGTTLLDHYSLGVLAIAHWARRSMMQLVRRIAIRNYGPNVVVPKIKFRQDDREDITPSDLVALIDAGAIVVDDELEATIRERSNLPPRNESEPGRVLPGKMPAQIAAARRREPGTAAAGGDANPTGVMVAFYLQPSVAADVALDGGEPADDLHVTLAFLGDSADLPDPGALQTVVAGWAAQVAPLAGEISGVGLFTAGDGPVTYLSLDLPSLPKTRQSLIDALVAAGQPVSFGHGFTPHVTLAYDDRVDDGRPAAGEPIAFDSVAVVIGGDRTDYPLTGTLAAARRHAARHAHAAAAPDPGSPAAQSKTDFADLQSAYETALAKLEATWRGVQAGQIADLHRQISEAKTVEDLAKIAPPVVGAAALTTELQTVLEHGAQSVVDAVAAQGGDLAAPDLAAAVAGLGASITAKETVLASALATSAASKAVSLAGADPDMAQIADDVRDYLHGLSGSTSSYELGGLVSHAQNAGRFAAMADLPDATRFYASALNDDAECELCAEEDETEFASLEEAQQDFPSGGYVGCLGGERCRCTVVAVLNEAAPST
jgi:hypothetical protein